MGDLVFAIVIMTLALWILRRLQLSLFQRDDRFVLTRAFAATLVVLVGIPIALVNWLAGALILGGAFLAWLVVAIVRKRRKESVPPLWPAAFVAVGLLLVVLFVQKPFTPSDPVPEAAPVPRAAVEGSDAQLAMTFRPILFFDSGELRYPLDIDEAIEDDRIDQCRKYLVVDRCPDVESAEDIDMTFDYLDIDESAPPPRGGGDESAYYYHVTRDGDRRFLDYWWFYSRNPSPVADKVFCGPGFRTPPFTCQEHAGDWEGMTVVVAPCEEESESCVDVGGELLGPTSVRYAQHAHLLSYSWAKTLEPVWGNLPSPQARALAVVWNGVVRPTVDKNGVRPVAFVARNSHASYPDACFGNCRQEVGSLPEARYDGGSRGPTTSPATAASSPCRSTRTEATRPGTRSLGAGAPRSASSPGRTATSRRPRAARPSRPATTTRRTTARGSASSAPAPAARSGSAPAASVRTVRRKSGGAAGPRPSTSTIPPNPSSAARHASPAGSPHVCQRSISMNAVTPRYSRSSYATPS